MTPLQLLAPARDFETGRQAILHGADAVYIGPETFGARAAAGNSIEDIRRLCRFAAPYGVKVYATVNTIVYDSEIKAFERLLWDLYLAGVDAFIVQDMAVMSLRLPPEALHASTQCDTRTPAKAHFLAECGFTQIVIPRETTLAETAEMARAAHPARIEAFVHGALCVCYSGDCQASVVNNGRSANRGACAQMCRLPYELIDGNGVSHGRRHYLSLRDLNRLESIGEMAAAGVTSFKIEGRLKDAGYVKNVVAAYRKAIDRVIESSDGRFCRASAGESRIGFTTKVEKSFNRGFTAYFPTARPEGKQASLCTPKSLGEYVGEVGASKGKRLTVTTDVTLHNGDGMVFIADDGATGGFRINRIDGDAILLNEPVDVPVGAKLYRNSDIEFERILDKETAVRTVGADFTLRRCGADAIVLEGAVSGCPAVAVSVALTVEKAQTPQSDRHRDILAKLGGTPYHMNGFNDEMQDCFVPASVLTSLRRSWVDAQNHRVEAVRKPESPGKKPTSIPALPQGWVVSRHDNIANRLAEDFYSKASATAMPLPRAIETTPQRWTEANLRVMTTRYCLRRELGACLKEGGARRLPGPLTLRSTGVTYGLEFDCAACRMHVVANKE